MDKLNQEIAAFLKSEEQHESAKYVSELESIRDGINRDECKQKHRQCYIEHGTFLHISCWRSPSCRTTIEKPVYGKRVMEQAKKDFEMSNPGFIVDFGHNYPGYVKMRYEAVPEWREK